MKTNLHLIKSRKGMTFEGIYGKILHLYNKSDELILHSSKPLIRFLDSQETPGEKFWLLEWEELETGENMLVIHERETPEPLEYEVIDNPNQKYVIKASSYYTRQNSINKVWGYGFYKMKEEIITSIVFELEDSFIHIEASPAIEIRITKERPAIHGSLSLLVSS
ncbi:hypothetical protein [Ferdinandcohnia sp. Marseille-Q9671]